ncbi:MAG: NAD(P)/FAD-dependent oxidoreductase [Acidimicrobiia bacterium]|nr:NAD(P)/FAD-dependent oxidoreductase [Acidimicrobiia bacterium]
MSDTADAVVIGSGPNGLVAAAMLARAGWSVTVLERNEVAGGAVASASLTEPGYVHDPFSAFYGLMHFSPVFRELELYRRVRWASFELPAGAMVGPGRSAAVRTDPALTSAALAGIKGEDGAAWTDLYGWWTKVGRRFLNVILNPVGAVGPTLQFVGAAGVRGTIDTTRMSLASAATVARERFTSEEARVLFAAGISHSDVNVNDAASTPGAIALAMVAQSHNMPVPVGGAGRLAEGLVSAVTDAGGRVLTGHEVTRVVVEGKRAVGVETAAGLSVRAKRAVLADAGPPRLFLGLVGAEHLPFSFLAGIRRFRYGSGIFKVDLALDGPAGWDGEDLDRCGVIHVLGDLDNMARTSTQVATGELPDEPMLVVGQPTVADPSRAPDGGHVIWLETHVPPRPKEGAWPQIREQYLERVLDRLDQHAPGLRSRIVGQAVHTPQDLEAANPNLVDGDLGGGSNSLDQQLVFRPVPGWFRYSTPIRGLYLCSASTHPGGGVHGMVGRNCAKRVLRDAVIRRV